MPDPAAGLPLIDAADRWVRHRFFMSFMNFSSS